MTILFTGASLHGYSDGLSPSRMPRKLEPTGHFVYNPGLGLSYSQNRWSGSALVTKDSFDLVAATAFIGADLIRTQLFLLGPSAGVYIRESHGPQARDFPVQMTSRLGGHALDIAPVIFAHLGIRVPLASGTGVELKLYSAVYLTHASLGLTFLL